MPDRKEVGESVQQMAERIKATNRERVQETEKEIIVSRRSTMRSNGKTYRQYKVEAKISYVRMVERYGVGLDKDGRPLKTK